MMNRRLFLGGLGASFPVITLAGTLRAQPRRPRLHAMVVGINKYAGQGPAGKVPDLEGCINDANDIARQVVRLDPNVRVLGVRNEPVTRAAFFSAWQSMVSAAGRGDTLLLTYSGHGGRVTEACAGNENDGLDETLILTNFDVRHTADKAEHIIDDELAALWAAAAERDLRVVFVADSCYSGTVFRNIELTDRQRHRTIRAYQLAPGGRAPVSCGTARLEIPENLLFLAGSQENEVVPEMELNGAWRGALSVAVARALEGGADANGDGVITGQELRDFVLNYVESLADSNQHPTVMWHGASRSTPNEVVGGGARGALLILRQEDGPPAAKAPVAEGPPPPPQLGPVRLQIRGLAPADQSRIGSSLTNGAIVGEREPASLIWDAERRLVFNDQGQRIAEEIDAGRLQHVVDRRRLLERIIQMSAGRSLSVRVHLPGEEAAAPPSVADVTHRADKKLVIRVSGVADGHYFTVFNLTGDGEVQLVEPRPSVAGTSPHVQAGGGAIDPFPVEVGPPFGADHVIVVTGRRRLNHLMPEVVRAHTQSAAAAANRARSPQTVSSVLAALDREAAAQTLQAGFKGIYTTRS
jgi:hypothetical protein